MRAKELRGNINMLIAASHAKPALTPHTCGKEPPIIAIGSDSCRLKHKMTLLAFVRTQGCSMSAKRARKHRRRNLWKPRPQQIHQSQAQMCNFKPGCLPTFSLPDHMQANLYRIKFFGQTSSIRVTYAKHNVRLLTTHRCRARREAAKELTNDMIL